MAFQRVVSKLTYPLLVDLGKDSGGKAQVLRVLPGENLPDESIHFTREGWEQARKLPLVQKRLDSADLVEFYTDNLRKAGGK